MTDLQILEAIERTLSYHGDELRRLKTVHGLDAQGRQLRAQQAETHQRIHDELQACADDLQARIAVQFCAPPVGTSRVDLVGVLAVDIAQDEARFGDARHVDHARCKAHAERIVAILFPDSK